MRTIINLPSKLYCPRCKTTDIIDHGKYIECPKCFLEFFKDCLGEIENGNILAEQELRGLIDSFKDLKEKKIRVGFLKSLKEDIS